MEGLSGRPGNLINAADTSAQKLVADQTGLRKKEGKDLLVYLEQAVAADMLNPKNQGTLNDAEWRACCQKILKAKVKVPEDLSLIHI